MPKAPVQARHVSYGTLARLANKTYSTISHRVSDGTIRGGAGEVSYEEAARYLGMTVAELEAEL